MQSRWSIRILLVLLIVALVAPLLGLTAAFGYRVYMADRADAEDDLLAVADVASMGVSRFLEDSRAILENLAANPVVRSMDPAACETRFALFGAALESVYANLATWRLDGSPVCSLLPTPDGGLDMSGTPGFEEALLTEDVTLTPVHLGRRSNVWSTVLTAPIYGPDSTHVGMISLPIDLVRFQEIVSSLNVPEDGIVSLTQLDGMVVARSSGSTRWVGSSPPASDARSRDDPSFTVRGTSRALTFDGQDFAWGFTRVPNTRWVVYAGRPFSAVYASVRSMAIRLVLFGAVVLLGAVLLGVSVYHQINRPLQALVEGIASASPDAPPLPVDGPAEIAWVAERFNKVWTARAHAEHERDRSDERARSMVENAVMGITRVSEDGTFHEVNQALVDMLGYDSREELLATPVVEIYPSPEERARHLAEHGSLERFHGVTATWRRKDGYPLHVRLSGRRLTLPDGRRGWETFVEDVTEVTRLQARYSQIQKMEALGRLAGGVAHDFNNLLTVVQGQADLLRDDPALDESQRQQVDEIFNAASRGAALNRQLLAFGRRSPSDKKTLDLNRVVRDFELVLRRAMGEDVDLQISLEPSLGFVKADRSRIEQILMNLLVNARDAMPRGGRVVLSTSAREVGPAEVQAYPGARTGAHVVLTVADDGVGIPDDVLPHIFESFFSTKPTSRGTGLGLATVYGIVADSGGHVRVRTELGQGTGFGIYLPVFEGEEDDASSAPVGTGARAGTGTVLLVEDEAGVRRLAQQILERAGYRVTAAADGRDALIQAAGVPGPFDLLLTDVVMPGLRGPELAEALAASGKVRRAVLFSGYPDGLAESGPPGIVAWRYLPKPFSAGQLLDVVEQILTVET